MHCNKKISGASVLAFVLLVFLAVSASAARVNQISDVKVKALADRDLVIFEVDRDVQPETAVKLYPTRIEAQFSAAELKTVSPKVKGTTLIKNVLVAGDTDTVVLVVYLDVKGKVGDDAYRWSRPRDGLLVLEVFYPLSDRGELTTGMLNGDIEPIQVESVPEPVAEIAEPEPPASLPSAFAGNTVSAVYFEPDGNTLVIRAEEPLEYELATSKFPPSLILTMPQAALSPTVDELIAKNVGAIRDIRVHFLTAGDACKTRVVIGFLNSQNIKFDDAISDGGRVLTVAFPEAENVVLPSVETPAPPPAPVVEEARPAAEKPPVPVTEEHSFVVNSAAPSGGVISYVNYDPTTMGLTIRASEPTQAHVVPIEFPRGYNVLLDLPPSEAVTGYIFKNDPIVRNLTVSEYIVGEEVCTRIILSFNNKVEYGFDHTGALSGQSFDLKLTPMTLPQRQPKPTMPAPSAGSYTLGSETSGDEGWGVEDGSMATVDDVYESLDADKDYPRMEIEGTSEMGDYELPGFEEFEGKLSDVLVNLNAATGFSVYQVLNLMSQIAGISIIIDPYITDEPIGGVANRRVLDPLDIGGDGSPIGFRDAAQFNALITEPGSVIGNFENVPWDTALDIILETHQFEKIVYRDEADPYAKPVILVTSRERKEQEIEIANEIDFYQLHYADPNEIYQILFNLDLLPSVTVGWYVYQNSFSGGGYGGGGGGQGGGGSDNNRGGGGSRYSADYPASAYAAASSSMTSGYFGTEPMQVGPGGGGGGGGFGGGGGAGGGGGIPIPTAKSGLVVMRGSRDTLDVVQSIIRKIDKPPKQAAVKITVYQVSENPQEVYGMLSATAQAPTGEGRWVFDYADGGLGLSILPKNTIMLPENYSATFDALISERKAKVVTESEIAVIDGFNGYLTVDRTRGNFRQTIAFDQNGNAIRQSTFDEVTVGTDIDFTVNIDDWGRMTMYVEIDISNFDGPQQVSPDGAATFQPTTSTTMGTYFRLTDGSTALIGGLQTREISDQIFAVPFLSKLPFVGNFFQHHSKSEDNSYVFITLTVNLVDDK